MRKEVKYARNNQKITEKGITLIALVITVIVLLILAGVTIATLTGDNGLLTKAGQAKQTSEESTALEKIKTEVAGSYNLEGKIDLNALKSNLKHLDIPNEDIITTIKNEKETFPVIAKINNYEYDILEDGTVENHINFGTLESLYGKVVNGYTGYEATDVTEWKLLYVDEENREAFIIASNTLNPPQPSANGIPLSSKSGKSYSGTNDIIKSEYGRKYNKLWLEQCNEENKRDSAKASAYLCDSENWKQYKTGNSKYAVGGATVEIIVASFYKKQISDFVNGEDIVNGIKIYAYQQGYNTVINSGLTNGGLYNTGTRYWLASPSSENQFHLRIVREDGRITGSLSSDGFYRNNNLGLRPVVCLPASAIEIVGEGENITLNYK